MPGKFWAFRDEPIHRINADVSEVEFDIGKEILRYLSCVTLSWRTGAGSAGSTVSQIDRQTQKDGKQHYLKHLTLKSWLVRQTRSRI